ncbi:MAG: ATP-dependent helicase [Acholeplasmatales bacterium]|nr:ATP-dependent helicase [Acholeplasmatales bacterium]
MLTDEQLKAINSNSDYILLIAGPGTGKTTVLTERIINMINQWHIPENRIHAFTFTNKATNEMKTRLSDKLGRIHEVGISNFHQYTFGYLATFFIPDVEVLIDSRKEELIKNLILERKFDALEVKEVSKQISRIKNNLPIKEDLMSKRLQLIEIYFAYEDYLINHNMLDFDGMNLVFLNILKSDEGFRELIQDEFDYILVDEAQDINWIQYEILKIMTEKNHHLFMVGDSNQSIYSFRGSDLKILDDFTKEYPVDVMHLTINHRSTKALVNATNNCIKHNFNKFNVPLVTNNEDGVEPTFKLVRYTTNAAEYIAGLIKKGVEEGKYQYKDYLILFRQNQSRGIYDQSLSYHGIPHYLYGIGFLEYKEIKYITSYYRIILNHDDNEAFTTVCNFPKRGIADVILSKIRNESYKKNISYFEASKELNDSKLNIFINIIDDLTNKLHQLSRIDFFDEIVKLIDLNKLAKGYHDLERRKNNISAFKQMLIDYFEKDEDKTIIDFINDISIRPKEISPNDCVKMMTIHQSKGLESKVVFIVDARDEMMPGNKKGINLEEERRVFYVATTRAKEMLYIISTEKNGPNDKHRNVPSRFISELKSS